MIKRFLFGSIALPSFFGDLVIFGSRLFVGLAMAIQHGHGKMPPPQMFIEGVGALGFPQPVIFAWAASLAELVFAALLALGLFTRLSALMVGSTMAVAAFMAHAADPFEKKEMALLYLATCAVFFVLGGGRFSLDRFFRKG